MKNQQEQGEGKTPEEAYLEAYYYYYGKLRKLFYKNYGIGRDEFHDVFHEAFIATYDRALKKYDENRGASLKGFVTVCIKNKILISLKIFEKGPKFNIDEAACEIEPGYFNNEQGWDTPITAEAEDDLIKCAIDKGLSTAKELTDNNSALETLVLRHNLPDLKRKAWTGRLSVNPKKPAEMASAHVERPGTPLRYPSALSLPVLRIRCWMTCSSFE